MGKKNCQWNHKGWPIILATWRTQAGEFPIRDLIGLHSKTLSRKEVGAGDQVCGLGREYSLSVCEALGSVLCIQRKVGQTAKGI